MNGHTDSEQVDRKHADQISLLSAFFNSTSSPSLLLRADALVESILSVPADDRYAELTRQCSGDARLFDFVVRLLWLHELSLDSPSLSRHTSPPLTNPIRLSPGHLLAGRYRVERELGRGAMGSVYEATDELLPRKVALKILHVADVPDSVGRPRLLEEAFAQARPQHDCVAAVWDVVRDEDIEILVLEFVAGGTLQNVLRIGPMKPSQVATLARDLFEGLAAAHSQGVIHGDLKPANLGISAYGRLKILDFGLATLLDSLRPRSSRDESRSASPPRASSLHQLQSSAPFLRDIRGTPAYMSPELFLGWPKSPTNDLFSCGLVLFECLTGRLPVDTAKRIPYNFSLGTRLPASPREINPQVPEFLDTLIVNLLRHDPSERPKSANDVLDWLQTAVSGSKGERVDPLSPDTAADWPVKARGNSRFRTLGIAGLSLFVLALPLTLLRHSDRSVNEGTAPESPAQRSFTAALEALDNREFRTARTCFADAVGYDSTFALAYYHWSKVEEFWDQPEEARRLASKAFEYRDNLSFQDRDLVEGWYFAITGKSEEALRLMEERLAAHPNEPELLYQVGRVHFRHRNDYRAAVELYLRAARAMPRLPKAFNDMAYCYAYLNLPDSALWSAREYVRLQPNEANPYDTLGDIFMLSSPESAEGCYRKALEIKANFPVPQEKLFHTALRAGRVDEAQGFIARMLDSDEVVYRAKGRRYQAQLELAFGRLSSALTACDQGVEADELERARSDSAALKLVTRAFVRQALGEGDVVLEDLELALRRPTLFGIGVRHEARLHRVRLLSRFGRSADAWALADSVAKDASIPRQTNYLGYEAVGHILLDLGRFDEAVSAFDRGLETTGFDPPRLLFARGEALASAGQAEAAIRDLRAALARATFEHADDPMQYVHGLALLGRLLEVSGDAAGAAESYRQVLFFWDRADSPLQAVAQEAREGLRRTIPES